MEKCGPGTVVRELRISKKASMIMGWYRFGLLVTLLVSPSKRRNQIRNIPVSSIATMEFAVFSVDGFGSESGLVVVLEPQDQLSSQILS